MDYILNMQQSNNHGNICANSSGGNAGWPNHHQLQAAGGSGDRTSIGFQGQGTGRACSFQGQHLISQSSNPNFQTPDCRGSESGVRYEYVLLSLDSSGPSQDSVRVDAAAQSAYPNEPRNLAHAAAATAIQGRDTADIDALLVEAAASASGKAHRPKKKKPKQPASTEKGGEKKKKKKKSIISKRRILRLEYNTGARKQVKGVVRKRTVVGTCKPNCKRGCTKTFTPELQQFIHMTFWSLQSCSRRHDFIAAYTTKIPVKVRTTEIMRRLRTCSLEYFFPKDFQRIQVCKQFFLKTLDVSDKVVSRAVMGKKDKNKDQVAPTEALPPDPTTLPRTRYRYMNESDKAFVKEHMENYPKTNISFRRKHSVLKRQIRAVNVMYSNYKAKCSEERRAPVTKYKYRKMFLAECDQSFLEPKDNDINSETDENSAESHPPKPKPRKRVKSVEDSEEEEDQSNAESAKEPRPQRQVRRVKRVPNYADALDEEEDEFTLRRENSDSGAEGIDLEAMLDVQMEVGSESIDASLPVSRKWKKSIIRQQQKNGFVRGSCQSGCKTNCAKRFSAQQQQSLHSAFWNEKSASGRVRFILDNTGAPKKTRKYFFPKDGEQLEVCKHFFMSTLDVSEAVVNRALLGHKAEGGVRKSTRPRRKPCKKVYVRQKPSVAKKKGGKRPREEEEEEEERVKCDDCAEWIPYASVQQKIGLSFERFCALADSPPVTCRSCNNEKLLRELMEENNRLKKEQAEIGSKLTLLAQENSSLKDLVASEKTKPDGEQEPDTISVTP